MKTCSCGAVFSGVPPDARIQNTGDPLDGHYWECECGSTLFVPLSRVHTASARHPKGIGTTTVYTSNAEALRQAECRYCSRQTASDSHLPFYEEFPASKTDLYYCGCRGWD